MNGSCLGLERKETGKLLFNKYRVFVLQDDKPAVGLVKAEQNRCLREMKQEDQQ